MCADKIATVTTAEAISARFPSNSSQLGHGHTLIEIAKVAADIKKTYSV
jgi:hypothetical protein